MSTAVGRAAEDAAVRFLRTKGFTIVAQNWRTRWCEIDIVAAKRGIPHLIEVKYRGRITWGSGFDYITPRKLQQMRFAADFWLACHKAAGCRLGAIELTGQPPRVTGWIDSLE